jgi:amino-acid N-acetyltransferase
MCVRARAFVCTGPAYQCDLLPEARRKRVNPTRNSQLYAKQLEASDGSEPGKRIGF